MIGNPMDFRSQVDLILNSIGEPIYILNDGLKILFYNSSFEKWLKKLSIPPIPKQEKFTENLPFLSKKAIKEYESVFNSGKSSITHEKIILGNDETIWIEIQKFPIKKEGNVIQVLTILRDNTEFALATQDLESLTLLLSQNPIPILKVEKDEIVYSNPKAKEIFKITSQSKVPETLKKGMKTALEANQSQQVLLQINQLCYSFTFNHLLKKDEVNVYGINITDLVKTKPILQSFEEKYNFITENTNDLIIVCDNLMKILNFNEKAHKHHLGYGSSELFNHSIFDFLHPFDKIKFQKQTKPNLLNNEKKIKLRVRHKDGYYRWFKVIWRSFLDRYKLEKHILILIPIPEHKEIQEKLKELNYMKTEILNRVSHELKTPLTSIKGYSELLKQGLELEGNFGDVPYINEILKGTERLHSKINEILETSNLIAKDENLNLEKENLTSLIYIVLSQLKSEITARRLYVKTTTEPNLFTLFDREKISTVLQNLLMNAIKFTPLEGNITKNLFKRFGKIERYGKEENVLPSGIGLGLFISKKIIHLHDGKIWMESEGYKKGSTFYFSLPIR
ncbi:MAG: PAS domain S-box protein [Candidatus Lokiarchaeota archaeon]